MRSTPNGSSTQFAYKAWLQLDFKNQSQNGNYEIKQYHQNYGFDLEKTLSKYPIKQLQNEKFKESLIRSLERGNLQSATFVLNGKEEKIFLTPNVAFKSLSTLDEKMQKVTNTGNELQLTNQQHDNKIPADYIYINHVSFIREEKQDEFKKRTVADPPHYDIRVIVNSYYKNALE